ncbi:hypothetical protein [Streptomyces xanthophaeus]|uniref:hypothetical protein n=1 Tax=Streptomyces xanthophaeus TaxID=67385 RepID=UPI00364CA33E
MLALRLEARIQERGVLKTLRHVYEAAGAPLLPGKRKFVRDQLAVRTDWKDGASLLQRYRTSYGVPVLVQETSIGPQMNPKLGHLPGVGTQVEIMEFGNRAAGEEFECCRVRQDLHVRIRAPRGAAPCL